MTTNKSSACDEWTQIIDCDAHFSEPADLWSSRAPGSLAARMPVQKTHDGVTAWYIDDKPWASIGGNTITHGMEKVLGTNTVQPFDAVDISSWSVKHRLELLDVMGIEAQILYPNGIGFSSNHIFAIEDAEIRTVVLQVYNDFLVDVQNESGGRLLPQGLLPIWDMELTTREMTRLIDKGIRGFTLSDKPELIGLPELPEPYFDPMWDLFNQSGTVASFHIGAGGRREDLEAARDRFARAPLNEPPARLSHSGDLSPTWTSFGRQRQRVVVSSQMIMSNFRIVANLCMSNLFDRYSGLKIVSAESGIGWVPYLLESLEYEVDEMITDADEQSFQQRRPTEYFRDHMYVMFWFEKSAPQHLVEDIGVNNILVESDVPHPQCLYPNFTELLEDKLSGLDALTVRRILHDNAAELYNVPSPASMGSGANKQKAS
jgi:uncharacterized protein